MPRSAVGGLLGGLGQGLMKRAENERQDVLTMRENAVRDARDLREQQFRTSERVAETADRGAQAETERRFRGSESEKERASNERIAGIRSSKDTSGISAGDQRLLNVLKARHTSEDENGVKTTDWNAIDRDLRKMGRADLAVAPDEGKPAIDVNSDQYRKAEEKADAWISNQASWLSTDSTDFKQWGGNREQARQAKVLEFYQQLTGGGSAPGSAATEPAAGQGAAATSFKSAEDVGEAFRTGKISRSEAERALREQFGYQ